MDFILHTFRPTETVDAVLKLMNRHDMPRDILLVLRQSFNQLNGMAVPRVGQTFKIPVEGKSQEYQEAILPLPEAQKEEVPIITPPQDNSGLTVVGAKRPTRKIVTLS
jgi:hypothetical protein